MSNEPTPYNHIPPGPFISPGTNPGSIGIWQPDFISGSPQPPPLAAPAWRPGTPYQVCTNTLAATAASYTMTVVTATTAGDFLIVVASKGSAQNLVMISVTDTRGNAYGRVTDSSPAGQYSAMWACAGSIALTTSDTITATFSGSGSTNVIVAAVSGIAATQAIDQVAVLPQYNGTAPSVSTGTLSQPYELAIAEITTGFAGGGNRPIGNGFTQLGQFESGGGPFTYISYKWVSATTAVTASSAPLTTNCSAALMTLRPLSFTDPSTGTDSSVLMSPGPFISPGPNHGSLNLPLADFYDGGQPPPLSPPGAQDPTATDPSLNHPPGAFLSPGAGPPPGFWAPAFISGSPQPPAPLLSPPVIPVFPAGYGPLPSDFTTWVTDSLGFQATGVVFRAEQAQQQSFSGGGGFTGNTITYDTVLEDPYGGWNPATSQWTAPFTGYYQVSVFVSIARTNVNLQTAIFATAGAQEFVTTQAQLTSSGLGGGNATAFLALVGTEDYVYAQVNPSGSCHTDVSQPGRYPTIEILFLSQ